MFWTYLLQCADGSCDTGHSENLEYRLAQHHAGAFGDCYTFKRRPLTLAWSQEFPSRIEALEAERQIKGWRRAKKQALIAGDWARIGRLARGKDRSARTIECI
jgi:predicted GIY-YIG superfamily endonuclease